MDFHIALISLILLINIKDFLTLERLPVTCDKNICAVKETSVTLRCSYANINFKTGFWFSYKQRKNWREKDEAEDLILDSDYSGRVKQVITEHQSELTIKDLRERDSGEYQLMFIMKNGSKYMSSVSVYLTVTVLQVKIYLPQLRLICDTSCTLTSRPQHVHWKKDGQYIQYINSALIEPAAYSCDLTGDFKISSAPLCVSDSGCWDVTYPSRRVCALVGSTVDIHSSYSHPTGYTVVTTYWHSGNFKFLDLREEQRFSGRVEYVGNTLRIKDVNMSDSGEYQFRIIITKGSFSGLTGVILTVTDTQVISSPAVVSEGEKVILSCSTKCTLGNNITFSWFKNGRPVTDGFKLFNKLYLDSVNNEELKEYSCTVTHHTSDPDNPKTDPWMSLQAQITIFIVILSVLLILAVIGVLTYRFLRRNKCKSCQNHHNINAEQPDCILDNTLLSTDSEEQILHYSSVSFKQSDKTTAIYSSIGDVQYAAVKLTKS